MCIIGSAREFLSAEGSIMAPVVPVTTSASSTGNLVQIMKPRLPRKVTRTPRINLNKYWNILEDIMAEGSGNSSSTSQASDSSERLFQDTDMNNEINENISNEQKEVDLILVRNNERNTRSALQSCSCNLCLVANLRNVTVSEACQDVTEL